MEITVETTNKLERKMTIAVPCEEVDSAVNARLQEAARTIRLNGFRKGKVPLKVVKKKFGPGVRQEVIGELMNKSYYEALTQENIRPAGQPRIESPQIEEGQDLTFTAVFEVYPDIELPDFSALQIETLTADVTEQNIDDMIETLREQRHSWQEVDRESADGDTVNIDYVGKRDGEEFEGGKAEGANLVLGSNRMIPGFESGLIGKKAGETTTLELIFPEQYQNAELAGKAVDFEVTINKVSAKTLPELDDEFFASFGVEEGGLEAFREEVAANMQREMKTAARTKLKNKAIDAVLEISEVTVPQVLVEGEIDHMRQQALEQMGVGPQQNIDPSLLPDELFREQAERRVISGLVLREIVKQQNMTADPVKVREAVEELASTYETPDEVVAWYYSNRDQLESIESSVIEDQVFDYILEQAQVVEKQVSYEEVIRTEPKGKSQSAKRPAKITSPTDAVEASAEEALDQPDQSEDQGKSDPEEVDKDID